MIKVLLIEDHEEMRDLISFNLMQSGMEILGFENANDGLIHMEDAEPDIILLDLMLPGLKGMQFLQIMRGNSKYDEIPVIVISAKNTEQDIVSALESGADDYLTKPFSMKVLAAKIKAMMRRKPATSTSKTISVAGIDIDPDTYSISVDGNEVSLTNKEYELIYMMLKNPKRVFTRNQILNSIWGYESDVYSRTVDTHVSSLRKKLGDKGQIIKSVPKIGYRIDLECIEV